MGSELTSPVLSSVLAKALHLEFVGNDVALSSVSALSRALENSFTFAKKAPLPTSLPSCTILGPAELASQVASLIISPNPRLDFIRALQSLEKMPGFRPWTAPASVHPSAKIGTNTYLGKGVVIEAGCVIGHNVVISDGVYVGEGTRIKSNAVIGEEGFGFERDENSVPIRMPHLGSVRIGREVEIGSFTTVCRGTLGDTVIEDFVKVDDHVHVAHNCLLKKRSMVIACAELSGGVVVGEDAWVAPSASVLQKVHIGARAVLGLGAVVLRNVEDDAVVVGNPARPLTKTAPKA